MEKKLVMLFMLFFLRKSLSQDTSDWVRIDCGTRSEYPAGPDMDWKTDDDFTKTGTNKVVSRNNYINPTQLNTLRAFTQQNKNCYTLPTPSLYRYFVRASFYYGNYDGLSNPPTFDLEIDGNKWTTVVTSSTAPVFFEIIYPPSGENTSVCLATTTKGQFAFISLLEAWPIPDKVYDIMDRNLAWLKSYRYNYGATDWILGYPADTYNRVWTPMIPPGVDAVSTAYTVDDPLYDDPPDEAMVQAIEGPVGSDKISLPLFTGLNGLNYLVVYFTEIDVLDDNSTREFYLYVNDYNEYTVSPQYLTVSGVQLIKPISSTMNIELLSTTNSTLPPIISALEIYTAGEPLVITKTSLDDLNGLGVFINTYEEQLGGWSGDPCLPSDTVWQWVECNGTDPPRVTSIKLSGNGLNGYLPDFKEMQALENIDLSNNSVDGPIPEFLGNLPNLMILNLRDNNFSGKIPESITKNKKIKYDIKGNPRLDHKRRKLGLIIGLAVGLPLGLICLAGILYYLSRTQPPPNQGQPIPIELVRPNGDANAQEHTISVSASGEVPANRPQANGNGTTVPIGNSSSSVSSNVDMDELDELLNQHGRAGANRRP